MAGRRLTLEERQKIEVFWGLGFGVRNIAERIGRCPSTVSRELRRPVPSRRSRLEYRALPAHIHAFGRARRRRRRKLVTGSPLRAAVARLLREDYSPAQIAGRLKREHPGDKAMQAIHEGSCQALFVQGKGGLRAEVAAAVRCGRARRRRPRSRAEERRGKIPGMISISGRPAEAADRAVPGHWEGDLIIGAGNQSAIGTLVERTTRFVMLLHLPGGHGPGPVAAAMTQAMGGLPDAIRRSLTWDQGQEMAGHAQIALSADLDIYFCDPHSPWQRGSNENTNGLLRQYFPKGTNLAVHSREHLQAVADELNARPRKTLGWETPAQALDNVLAHAA